MRRHTLCPLMSGWTQVGTIDINPSNVRDPNISAEYALSMLYCVVHKGREPFSTRQVLPQLRNNQGDTMSTIIHTLKRLMKYNIKVPA